MTADHAPSRHGKLVIQKDGPAAPALALERLCLDYGPTHAVDHVNLTVGAGEILCLLGQSGSGKSSVLRLVAGIERPTAGTVFIHGAVVAGEDVRFTPPEHRSIGLVFQDFALFPHLSVLGNVTFGLAGEGRTTREARGLELLDRVGLAGRARDYPHTLSGGEQQRVALARALAPRPKLLLLDEPFSNLDAHMRVALRETTVEILREERVAALFVTHDAEEAMAAGDRIALMRAGRIIQAGAPAEVYDAPVDPEAGRLFGPLNLIPARIRAGVAESALGSVPAPGRAEGAALWLAFRPHAAHILPSDVAEGAPARVEKRHAAGPDLEVTVRPETGDAGALEVRIPRGQHLEPGASIRIAVDPAAVLLYDAEIAGTPPI